MNMDQVICSPEEYYGPEFLNFINKEYSSDKNRWIYNIIKNGGFSRH